MNLQTYLSPIDPALAQTVQALADAAAEISQIIKTASTGKAGTQNDFGEDQLALDVQADNIIFDGLKKVGTVATASSEEQASAISLNADGQFSVAFDPLDGSSLVDVNLAVGTIWGIWPGAELIGRTGAEQVAAGYAVYGPRTTFVLAIEGEVSEFTLQADGSWLQTAANLQIDEGKMFAPGNLRAAADNAGYRQLIDFWAGHGYTLRYSGGMVPDINQILLKGKGVFSYPGSEAAPAKLRLLYECAPLAKVIETAGGASSDGSQSISQLKIGSYDQRVPVCLGSQDEVQRFEQLCV